MRCFNCNAENESTSAFCVQCGAPLTGQIPSGAGDTLLEGPAAGEEIRFTTEDEPARRVKEIDVNKPLSALSFLWMFFVMLLPVFNVVTVLWWAFSRYTNKNKRHFAAAVIIVWALLLCGGAAAYTLLPGVRYAVDSAVRFAVDWVRGYAGAVAAVSLF